VRLVEEAVATPGTIDAVVYAPTLEKNARGRELLAALARTGVPMERVEESELEQLADTQHPQGIIAVIRMPAWTLAQIRLDGGPVLVLDGLQDPGNTGTILRTALGLGAAGVVALPGTVELSNPKVVRGSMGAVFHLPAVELGVAEFLAWAGDRGVTLLAAEANGAPIGSVPIRRPVAIVLGNEGAGLRAEIRQAGRAVAIPLARGTESLNVAVAAGILLYEVTRDR
jgi:TrmH family RNA methyltransferase